MRRPAAAAHDAGVRGPGVAALAALPGRVAKKKQVADLIDAACTDTGLAVVSWGSRESRLAAVAVHASRVVRGEQAPHTVAGFAHGQFDDDPGERDPDLLRLVVLSRAYNRILTATDAETTEIATRLSHAFWATVRRP